MRIKPSLWVAVLLALSLLAACGGSGETAAPADETGTDETGTDETGTDGGEAADGYQPPGTVTFLSGFDPGGGIDLAINTVFSTLEAGDIVDVPLRLDHQPGGSGLVAVSELVADHQGAEDIVLLTALSTQSGTIRQGEGVGLGDLIPISRLFSEYTYVYVQADSSFETLQDLADAITANPADVQISGGSLGSADSLTVAQLANVLGLTFSDITYIPTEGGEGATAILGGQTDAHFGGPDLLDLVEGGELRVLAVSADERLGGDLSDIPTFIEAGFEVSQPNWRGVFGPPSMPAEAVEFWEQAFASMVETPTWEQALEEYGWDDAYLGSEEFEAYLEEQRAALTENLTDLGLVQ